MVPRSEQVKIQSGVAAYTVTERQIRDVPLVNRSVLDLASTLPNVSGDAGTENPAIVTVTTCPGCNLSLNGGLPMNTLMMADGADNTGVILARTMVSFSADTVQEFTVHTSTYSAEFGGTSGAHLQGSTFSIHYTTSDELAPAVGLVSRLSGAGDYLVTCHDQTPGYNFDVFGYLWGNRLHLPMAVRNH